MWLLVGVSTSSCVSHPPAPPVVTFYIHDLENHKALCASSDGKECPAVDISNTANWWLLPPNEMQKIQDYVDLLYCIAEGGCQSEAQVMGISRQDAKYRYTLLKRTMKRLKAKTEE